jgi:hypothetical protein
VATVDGFLSMKIDMGRINVQYPDSESPLSITSSEKLLDSEKSADLTSGAFHCQSTIAVISRHGTSQCPDFAI